MGLVNFSNLDFNQIKTTIKDYLRSNSQFTDYDFEGSTLSNVVDVLAYNTYITSFNANMIANEVFIDSATLRENVVALARNIGYVPRSRTSSRANVTFEVDTENFSGPRPITLTLKRGIAVSGSSRGQAGSSGGVFSVLDDITVPVINDVAKFDNIEVVEGTFVTENFVVDTRIPGQRFILGNAGIDVSTIRVNVRDEKNRSFGRKFTLSDSIFEVNSKSKVFFIQEVSDERYELIFGDGIFGEKLENNNFIEVSYIISNGETSNGISEFRYTGRLFTNNDAIVTSGISIVLTNASSRGGKAIESVNSIRNYAPRIYASQYRAVTSSDYEALIPQIYPEAESVSVFGGEVLNPPQYGRVFITIKPINGQFVPNFVKDNLKSSLRKYTVAGIVPEILDLKYLYVEFSAIAYYNTNKIESASKLIDSISKNVLKYAKSTELNSYGARFKYSKFLNIIDKTNESITSNITKIEIRRDLRAALNQFAGYEICYGNSFFIECESGYNLRSSGFKISGVSDTVYISDIPDSNLKKGKLVIFKLTEENKPLIVRKNAGEIDYEKGEILLYPINIIQTDKVFGNENIIELSLRPRSNDIIALQDLYLQLDVSNSLINAVQDSIVSGNDTSGSIFKASSSYSDRDLLVRR
ncbi:MAG: hypothetical protein ACO3CQ_00105 [Candidatus Nanopelagicaceae bacterium]